jgi:hypothetical protein
MANNRNIHGHAIGMCYSGDLCIAPQLHLKPEHKFQLCRAIVHTLCSREVIVDRMGGFQVCSKCTMSKHQTKIRAEIGRDEEQDEDEGGGEAKAPQEGASQVILYNFKYIISFSGGGSGRRCI